MQGEEIEVEVKISQRVDVKVEIEDVIEAINELPFARRWNYLSLMLNEINNPIHEFTEDQRKIVIAWLEKQIKKFKD